METAEATITLSNVPWQAYELLVENTENSGTRLTYNKGKLTLVSPTPRHELSNDALVDLVKALADNWEIEVRNFGTTSFRLPAQEQGLEADSCFYIHNLPFVTGLERINVGAGDPPPDLAIEIDVTSSSEEKLPIYAQMGVPEVWRMVQGLVSIYVLVGQSYEVRTQSHVLGPLSTEDINGFVARNGQLRRLQWLREIREWAQTHPPTNPPLSQESQG